MARGKRLSVDTVDEADIIDLGEEVNPPNGIFEEDETTGYGFTGKYGDYALVIKKIAHRTGKAEDGEYCDKVIRYCKWEDVNYSSTLFGVLNSYIAHRNLSKTKALKKVKEFSEIEKIYKETQANISTFLGSITLDNDTKKVCELYDTLQKIKSDLSSVEKVLEDADKLNELIKEKRRIIIANTEPKKHRVKLEK